MNSIVRWKNYYYWRCVQLFYWIIFENREKLFFFSAECNFADFLVFASLKLDSRKAITRKFIISKIRKYIICATERKMRARELVSFAEWLWWTWTNINNFRYNANAHSINKHRSFLSNFSEKKFDAIVVYGKHYLISLQFLFGALRVHEVSCPENFGMLSWKFALAENTSSETRK
jgi:hypothetical protein